MTAAVAPSPTITGSRCTSEQAPDGTWTVRNVPLFGEMTYTSPSGKTIHVDKAWLEAAVAKAVEGYQRAGYVPPLHVNHHGFGDPVRAAGKFLPTRVARTVTRDGEVWAAFGDFVGVFPEVYEEIRKGRLPYLSCEAHMEKGLLESCALLPTRPPVHKFTPLTIGTEQSARKSVPAGSPLVAFALTGVGVRALSEIPHMNSAAACPPKDPLKAVAPVKAAEKLEDEDKGTDAAPPADDAGAPPPPADAPPVDAMPPAEDPAMAGAPPPADPMAPPVAPPAATVDPVVTLMTNLGTKMDAMMSMLTKLLEPAGSANPGEPVAVAGSPSTAMADPNVRALEMAVKGIGAKLDAKVKADDERNTVATYEKRLARFSHALPELHSELEVLYRASGEPGLAKFAQAIERTVRPDPTLSQLDREEGDTLVLPDDLAKFANRGPEEIASVVRLSREYDSRGAIFARTMSREAFVDMSLRREALLAPRK